MILGAYGDVVFSVSSDTVKTFNNLRLTQSAAYQQHKVHGAPAVIEFTGFNAPQISFEMVLSAYLGVNPREEKDKLTKMMESKQGYPLTLGGDMYGNLWVITNLNTSFDHMYKDGTPITQKVQVTLLGMETE